MTLWKYEIKKMFFIHKGMMIVLLFCFAELALLIFGDVPANTDAALYREEYLYYLEQVDGPYTEEKSAFLENEARAIAEAKSGLEQIYKQYRSGQTGGDMHIQSYTDRLSHAAGFDVIYDQYLYANEEPSNRYFLDANGWAGLMADSGLDFPLILAIGLLAVPVYCGEAVCEMDKLVLTTKAGRQNYLRHKLILTVAIVSSMCLIAAVMRYGLYALRYGLPHGDYPMQSLQLFGDSTKEMSLAGAYLLTSFLRLIGSLQLALIALFFSALCQQFALTAFLSFTTLLLPWASLSPTLQYRLPLPCPFLLAVGFLQGSKYQTDLVTGEIVTIFQEVSWVEMGLLLAGICLLSILMLLFIRKKYQTALSKKRKQFISLIPICLTLALLLCSCAGDDDLLEVETVYNSHTSKTYQYEDISVYFLNDNLIAEDRDGNITSLTRDALLPIKGYWFADNLFGCGKYVYYLRSEENSYGRNFTSSGKVLASSLVRVDLDTLDERVVFENIIQYTVLGVDISPDDTLSFLHGAAPAFFVNGDYLYVIRNGLQQISLRTGEVTALDISTAYNIAFDGTSIFFVNNMGELSRYDTVSGETYTRHDLLVDDFCLTPEGLYFIDLRQSCYLYYLPLYEQEPELVLAEALYAVEWDGENLAVSTTQAGEKKVVKGR